MDYSNLYKELTSVSDKIRSGAFSLNKPKVQQPSNGIMKRTMQRMKQGQKETQPNTEEMLAGYFSDIYNQETQELEAETPDVPLGYSPRSANEKEVYQGLIDRGMKPDIARAFVMNFKDESGLKEDIVETEANVHGTFGKGLYQLTGDRREAFEAKYGDDYSVDNQLDWMMHELSTTEKSAWEKIQGAGNTGEAAAAVVTHFLRPAKEHRDSRVAKYLETSQPILAISGEKPIMQRRP